jgi:hypothetical protein
VPTSQPQPSEPDPKRGRESFPATEQDEKDSRPLSFSLADRQQFRTVRERGQLVLRPAARRADSSADFVPKDPFDPEIFNRRFFGR